MSTPNPTPSPLSQLVALLGADIQVGALPALANFFNTSVVNSKLPLALQAASESLALMTLQQQLINALPGLEQSIVAQINTIVQAKLQAQLASAQATIAAATATGAAGTPAQPS